MPQHPTAVRPPAALDYMGRCFSDPASRPTLVGVCLRPPVPSRRPNFSREAVYADMVVLYIATARDASRLMRHPGGGERAPCGFTELSAVNRVVQQCCPVSLAVFRLRILLRKMMGPERAARPLEFATNSGCVRRRAGRREIGRGKTG